MKSGRNEKFAIGVAIVGALVLMVACRFLIPDILYPVERAKVLLCQVVWPRLTAFLRAASVQAENAELRRKVAALSLAQDACERLEQENARLRRALDYEAREPGRWLCAHVLSSGGGAAGIRETLRVDKGSAKGVEKGALVVVPDGLVGRVTAVSRCTSEVTLITDPSLKVACEIASGAHGRARGILLGGGDDRLVVKYLRNAGALAPQARVLTSGLGGVFPRGIAIGTLLTVTNGVHGVEGEVLPAVDYSTLEDVFIRRDK